MTEISNLVTGTRVLNVRTLIGPENRLYREILVAYPGFSFQPGQFMMIKKDCGCSCWAYPYMVQSKNEVGLTIYAVKGTSLFDIQPDIPLVVWGPSGKPVPIDESTVIVIEPATAFLATPILNKYPDTKYIALISKEEEGCLSAYKNGSYVGTIEAAGKLLDNMRDCTVIGVLNITNVQKLAETVKGLPAQRLFVFASTRINCGVDGCKGCYLHNKEMPLGLSVCCNGPYLLYDKIDFEADVRCFHTFE